MYTLHLIAQERMKDIVREVEHQRLARLSRAKTVTPFSLLRQIRTWVNYRPLIKANSRQIPRLIASANGLVACECGCY